jgi:hypothetical protein
MFKELVARVTDDRDHNPPTLTLNKSIFLLDKKFIIGRHLTRSFLGNKTVSSMAGLVRGRTLQRIAKTSVENIKKTMAFILSMPEVDKFTREAVVYKSAISEDEVKSKLLDQMFIELNRKADGVNLDDDNDVSN